MCLLHLLCTLRQLVPFELYAAHVNHGIRGEEYGGEAKRDEIFCRKQCERLGVKLFVAELDVPSLSKETGQSLETAARNARYEFFRSVMLESSIKVLATAHNADDNLETQLFNLCRGCGIEGICGIPESRPIDGINEGIAIRPILSASKQEIIDYCLSNGIEYVTDSTNLVDDCVRNKLRLNLIPQLKEIFGSPERSGTRLSQYASEDRDYILSEARKALESEGDDISLSSLRHYPPALSKRMIMLAYKELYGSSLEGVHVQAILDLALSGRTGSISLPSRTRAALEDGYLRFKEDMRDVSSPSSYHIALDKATTLIPDTLFAVSICPRGEEAEIFDTSYQLYASALIRLSKSDLTARNRAEGDVILSGGMHKKIKKLMCDKKIPGSDREALPLIFSGDELIYAPLCAVSDNVRADKNNFDFKISIYKKSKQNRGD